jgi:ethanolamine utilization protein EutN
MRIAEVIGTVTLSRCHPTVTAFRWIIGAPFSQKALRAGGPPDGEPLVIFDDLGAGFGQKITFAEGGESAVPFMPEKKPIDAYCSCILDQVQLAKSGDYR